MSSIKMICVECKKEFNLLKKEYTRQIKKGRKNFFCSLSCAGQFTNFHLSEEQKLNKGTKIIHSNKNRKWPYKFKYYLYKASQKNLNYDIDEKFLEELWNKQKSSCALSGVPITLRKFNEKSFPSTASLDRIDSSKGYIRGNVQFVAYSINLAKNSFRNQQIVNFINQIKSY